MIILQVGLRTVGVWSLVWMLIVPINSLASTVSFEGTFVLPVSHAPAPFANVTLRVMPATGAEKEAKGQTDVNGVIKLPVTDINTLSGNFWLTVAKSRISGAEHDGFALHGSFLSAFGLDIVIEVPDKIKLVDGKIPLKPVPLPASIWLFTTGLGILLGVRRTRKKIRLSKL